MFRLPINYLTTLNFALVKSVAVPLETYGAYCFTSLPSAM